MEPLESGLSHSVRKSLNSSFLLAAEEGPIVGVCLCVDLFTCYCLDSSQFFAVTHKARIDIGGQDIVFLCLSIHAHPFFDFLSPFLFSSSSSFLPPP